MKKLTHQWQEEILAEFPGVIIETTDNGVVFLTKGNGDIKVWSPSGEWTCWFIPHLKNLIEINLTNPSDEKIRVWSESNSSSVLSKKGIINWRYCKNQIVLSDKHCCDHNDSNGESVWCYPVISCSVDQQKGYLQYIPVAPGCINMSAENGGVEMPPPPTPFHVESLQHIDEHEISLLRQRGVKIVWKTLKDVS